MKIKTNCIRLYISSEDTFSGDMSGPMDENSQVLIAMGQPKVEVCTSHATIDHGPSTKITRDKFEIGKKNGSEKAKPVHASLPGCRVAGATSG